MAIDILMESHWASVTCSSQYRLEKAIAKLKKRELDQSWGKGISQAIGRSIIEGTKTFNILRHLLKIVDQSRMSG